jgi:hypothetical protein
LSAQIDPDSGLRYYLFNDRQLVSVTSMRRVVGMPFALANWQVSQAIRAAALIRGTSVEKALDEEQYPKHLRKATMAERDAAAALGSSVHHAAEQGVRAADLADTDDRKPFLVQYEAWRKTMGPNILLHEAQVFHLSEGYAGSLDLIADVSTHMRAPTRYLVDLKTGKGTYTDHAIQLALYFGAQFIGGFDPIEGQDVIFPAQSALLEGCERAAILHLRPDGWEFIEVPITDELAAAALDMVHLARFFLAHPTIETLKGATFP